MAFMHFLRSSADDPRVGSKDSMWKFSFETLGLEVYSRWNSTQEAASTGNIPKAPINTRFRGGARQGGVTF